MYFTAVVTPRPPTSSPPPPPATHTYTLPQGTPNSDANENEINLFRMAKRKLDGPGYLSHSAESVQSTDG